MHTRDLPAYKPTVLFGAIKSAEDQVKHLAPNRLYLKGVWPGGECLVHFSNASHMFDRPASELPGEWLAISTKRDSLEIYSDYFGLFKVYYTLPELNELNLFAISDSYPALCDFLERNCSSLKSEDLSFIPALLDTNSNFYFQQHSPRTSVTSIRCLEADEYISVDAYGATVRPRTDWWDGNDQHLSDSQLIDEAVSKGAMNLSREIQSAGQQGSPVRFFLSGGKDSRACLSLLNSSCGLGCIYAVTKVPDGVGTKFRKDFKIAVDIATGLGMRFGDWSAPLLGSNSLTFAEDLKRWQMLSGASNYQFFPRGREDIRSFSHEIRGGLGEAFRGYSFYYSGLRGALDGSPASVEDDLYVFFDHVTGNHIQPRARHLARDYFIEYLTSVPGDDIYAKLDNHYVLHRNRTHFANVKKGLLRNARVCFPLQLPELFWASRLQNRSLRSAGKVLFDVIERTMPLLNQFEFEDGGWPKGWRSVAGHFSVEAGEFDRDGLYERRKRNSAVFAEQLSGISASNVQSVDPIPRLIEYAFDLAEILTDKSSIVRNKYLREYISNCIETKNVQKLARFVAKADIFCCPSSTRSVEYDLLEIDDLRLKGDLK